MVDWLLDATEQIWSFYREGLFAALGLGLVAPLLGCLIFAQRSPLLGLVVPELAGMGVSLSYLCFPLLVTLDWIQGSEPGEFVQTFGAGLGVLVGLVAAAALAPRSRDVATPLALLLVVAGALSEVFLLESTFHEFSEEWLHHGRLLTVRSGGATRVLLASLILGLALVWLHRPLLRNALDSDQARLLGQSRRAWLLVSYCLLGAFVSATVPVVGPDAVLPLLLIPPYLLRGLTRTTAVYALMNTLAGVASAALTFYVALARDWPSGPALAFSVILVCLTMRGIAAVGSRFRPSPPSPKLAA